MPGTKSNGDTYDAIGDVIHAVVKTIVQDDVASHLTGKILNQLADDELIAEPEDGRDCGDGCTCDEVPASLSGLLGSLKEALTDLFSDDGLVPATDHFGPAPEEILAAFALKGVDANTVRVSPNRSVAVSQLLALLK